MPLWFGQVPRNCYRQRLAAKGLAAKISWHVLLVLAAKDCSYWSWSAVTIIAGCSTFSDSEWFTRYSYKGRIKVTRARSPFIPANPSMRSSVRRHCSGSDGSASFLLFVRVVLLQNAQEASSGRASGGCDAIGTKTSCPPQFHCAKWSCVVLSNSSRHRIESGRH